MTGNHTLLFIFTAALMWTVNCPKHNQVLLLREPNEVFVPELNQTETE